ncbi:cupin domain-containing protein [Novosphingobium sp.]|uniref:cupin domain-containing protein n=1 Tax=Novosphingobium sp. TaxID=1874826 RepID=UPI0025E94247|nr:cupin domain-containing protein [Novosphingobium sp.]MCC6925112.1 cupin domain-containing protein [Novosphingobium sp.]
MTQKPFTVAYGGLPLEGEARDGELTWQTLICADRTPSGSLVVGVAEFPPGGHLKFHRHDPAEFYFCLAGSAVVYADDQEFELRPDVAAFIPSRAEHAIVAGPDGLKLLYGFARDRFAGIEYDYTGRPLG